MEAHIIQHRPRSALSDTVYGESRVICWEGAPAGSQARAQGPWGRPSTVLLALGCCDHGHPGERDDEVEGVSQQDGESLGSSSSCKGSVVWYWGTHEGGVQKESCGSLCWQHLENTP